ncbi:hypothetical protein C2S51_031014 [Perilla frutescens var. frutescens]|nr:hypothetical protein C2S51_031014 [Perilla frutescens var. frutescens]
MKRSIILTITSHPIGGCAVQQALTSEAAGVVKQAVVLAKRRGHAQVTPMHVATTMLAAGGGLLRAACLQSYSHPLQCKALELCFNVALNRLPAASSNPILGHHDSHYPSISNALVAAFKRAQAHQRRGAADNQQQQQQPLLTVKIELEQLIISILDDPSVSRVMREAGFSSPQVKNNLEKSISSSSPVSARKSKENKVVVLDPSTPIFDEEKEDLNIIIEALVTSKKHRSFVVVGESISNAEKTVRELMDRVERGGVPQALREVKFITIPPFYSLCNLRRELVQQKIDELTFLVKSLVGKGVVLYLGDLNWISEYRVSVERERERERERSYYCSVEHMIVEVGRLVCGMEEINGRFWLMGIGTFQTYMRCRNGYNSLQMIWRLHPLTIPANTLGLSLVSHSYNEHGGEARNERDEVKLENGATLSSLPPWLKDESRRLANYNDQNCESIKEQYSTLHRQPKLLERTLTLSSAASPSSSNSCFSFDQNNPNLHQSHFSLPQNLPFYPSNSTPNSPSSADTVDAQRFKEFNANNLNTLCNALEEKVPRQKQIIPEIAGTILQCRSRMVRRKQGSNVLDHKEETWMFFLGQDAQAKVEISRNLAKFVFGSYSNFVSIGMSRRERDDRVCSSYVERFAREVSANPHRVFLLEDFERVDCSSRMRIKGAIERGRMSDKDGEEFSLFDAIVILSCERFSSTSSPETENAGAAAGDEGRSGGGVSLDLNMSFGDDSVEKLQSFDDLEILENVDRIVVFKILDL